MQTTTLSFAQCSSIFEHKLRSLCRTTHQIEVVQRRCEKGFFIRSNGRPSIAEPIGLAYQLRNLPAWKGVRIQVGLFLEGFVEGMETEDIAEFMVNETEVEKLKWMAEGVDLYIAPRGDHKAKFSPDAIQELEAVAGKLEREDRAVLALYVEIQVPYH